MALGALVTSALFIRFGNLLSDTQRVTISLFSFDAVEKATPAAKLDLDVSLRWADGTPPQGMDVKQVIPEFPREPGSRLLGPVWTDYFPDPL